MRVQMIPQQKTIHTDKFQPNPHISQVVISCQLPIKPEIGQLFLFLLIDEINCAVFFHNFPIFENLEKEQIVGKFLFCHFFGNLSFREGVEIIEMG